MRRVLLAAEQGEHQEAEDGHRGQEGEEAHPEEDPVDLDLHRAGLPHHLRHLGGHDALLHQRVPGQGGGQAVGEQQHQLLAKSSPAASQLTRSGREARNNS